jgi:hypothetical protein
MRNNSEEFNYRKYLNELDGKIKLEKDKERIKLLKSVRHKMALWAKMEEGDIDALMELSIMAGLDKREDWERVKRECAKYENEKDKQGCDD